ncbi:MAG: aminotransferase class V-fold PLP-dependent enzyme [Spirochaetales bacterium]|nr:aminotransferase class V-fold PLP-dependent enzyme [Spirochaetales bacterium]
MDRIYLDNNATTVVDPKVKQAMEPFWLQRYGNPNSLHRFGTETHPEMGVALDRLYAGIGAADADDVIVNGCATEGNNTILKAAWVDGILEGKKSRIVSTAVEHPSVAHTLDWLEQRGVEVIRLQPNHEGLITPEALAEGFDADKTALVSIMWANNETGIINPVKELAEFCREKGVPFHTDAVQAVGKVPVNLQEVGADYLTFSAHKFHGPKGAGGLFVRSGCSFTPLLHGGEQMGGLRAGTVNVPFFVGMGLAMELAVDSLHYAQTTMATLRNRLEDAILALPDTMVLGKREHRTPNTILASFKGIEGEAFLWDLNQAGVAASTGSACSSESLEADATLRTMVSDADLAHTAVRFSLSRFTTEEEIERVISVVEGTVKRLRAISSTY